MKKLLITTLTISGYLFSSAQDSLHSVRYENLKEVSFPSRIDSAEAKGVKVFYSNTSDLLFECLIPISPDDSVTSPKKFDRRLQIFIEGFCSSEAWKYHNREQVDTTIGSVEGKLVHGYEPSKPGQVKEFFSFFTIVNRRYYVIMLAAKIGVTSILKRKIYDVLETVKFEGKNY
jgi:hypothetical protein